MLDIGPETRKTVGDAIALIVCGGVLAEGVRSAMQARKAPHAALQAHDDLFRVYPSLRQDIDGLLDLQNEAAVRKILALLDSVRKEDASKEPGSQWRIARLNANIMIDATRLVDSVPCVHKPGDLCTSRLLAKEHVLPSLRDHLDVILHNHMLSVVCS